MTDLQQLPPELQEVFGPGLVVLGIGNTLRGDDGAGPELAENLIAEGFTLPCLNTETVPENYIGVVKRLRPAVILLVDTADLGLPPGSCRILPRSEIVEEDLSTHRLSLAMLMEELEERTGGRAILLAIQPGQLSLGEGLSPSVRTTVDRLRQRMLSWAAGSPASD